MNPNNPNPERKWKNMRRMAWITLTHGLTAAFYIKTAAVLTPILMFDAAVVGAYMGFSSISDGFGKQPV